MRRWLCKFLLARARARAVFMPAKAGIRAAVVVALTLGGIASATAQTFTLTVLPTTIPAATQNQAYSQTMDAAGGTAPYSFAVTSGALPTGFTLALGGLLSGTTATPGTYNFTITATDVNSNTGFRPYTFTVGTAGGITVNPPTLPDGSVGVSYSQTITTTGGTGSGRVFSISSGALPNGLSINSSSGAITGTPTTGGPFTFTVFVRDSGGNTGTNTYTVNIGANILVLSPTTLPNGTQGTPYTHTIFASGGTPGYTFTLASGTMPTGTSIASNGNITGTPTVGGPFTFTIRATDSVNNVGTQTYNVTIGSNILTVTPPTLPNGSVGTAYSQNFGATGGNGSYTFARTSGALPTGLTLTSGGVLSGTPSASGTFNFDITATDTNFNTGTRSYSVTINLAPLTISPSSLPAGTVGTSYSQTVVASGGNGNYSYTVLSGALPTGLSMDSAGNITGTPSATGAFNFTVQATDTTPNTGTRNYTINVGSNILALTPTTLPNGTNGTAYSQTITATGATGAVSFVLASGGLPAGLSISSGGVISGTPSGSGSSTFTIRGTDSVGNTGSQAYTVNIGTGVLVVAPAALPAGTQNTAYNQTVTASGGTGGPYTFTISSGALPAGLTMSSAGVIGGTPTGSGASTFTVRGLDSLGNFGTHIYTLTIGTVSLTVNPASLPATVVGHPYSQIVSATGGTASYTFSISAGALPPGLTLNPVTGVISGTPTGPGTASFTVQATDVNGNTGTRAYALSNRPDPALDPEVQGLIAAQVAAAQRFASAQIDNIARHLERLHGHFDPCSVNIGVAPPIQQGSPYPDYANPNSLYSPSANYGRSAVGLPSGYAPAPGAAAQPAQAAPRPPGASDCASDWAIWTAGSFQFGSMTPNGVSADNHFTTAGMTAGVDIRVGDNLIVGAALGMGIDRSDVGQNGTRSNASSFSGALYASLRPFDPLFFDGALGYGTLGYDNRRWVSDDSTTVSGTRKGSYWFGTLEASYEMRRDQVKFAPYARTNFIAATLNGYAEGGPSAELLTYDAMKFNAVSGAIGLRGSIDIPMSFGVFSPTARFEYKQTSQNAFDQSLYYSDLGAGTSSTFSQPAGVYGMTTGALGFRARTASGLAAEVEYGISGGTGALRMQSLRGTLRMPL